MGNWQIETIKADQAANEIQNSSLKMEKLTKQYTEAKAQLLKDWQGSMRDEFVSQTGDRFEAMCMQLIKNMQILASSVTQVKSGYVNADQRAADIISNR